MGSKEFIELCKQKVVEYFNEKADKTVQKSICEEDVFVVRSCKTLQNNQAILRTNVADGMYYELTYNRYNHELYFDAYKKWGNFCISVDSRRWIIKFYPTYIDACELIRQTGKQIRRKLFEGLTWEESKKSDLIKEG